MGKRYYDYLTVNKQNQVVKASYDVDSGTWSCPGGFKYLYDPGDEDSGTSQNLGNLSTYVED